MSAKVMGAEKVRREWRTIVDTVVAGEDVVVERYSRPAVAVIAYADCEAIRDELEDLRSARRADAIRVAWLNGKRKGIPWKQARAELRVNRLLDD
jgi:PHD/YefM family antitoxin component YafN of YafNO toxin-antitoxin module